MISWEKLKDASKLIIVPGVILYAFGFITITSYLARFGIISFDIVNSRFIVAGVFPIIFLAISMLLAWNAKKSIPFNGFFKDPDHWFSRAGKSVLIYFETWGLAYVLLGLLKIGKYIPPFNTAGTFYPWFGKILGRWDVIGKLVSKIDFKNTSNAFFIKTWIYAVGYGLGLLALIILIIFTSAYFFPNKPTPTNPPLEDKTKTDKETKYFPQNPKARLIISSVSDTVFLISWIVLFIFCTIKLQSYFLDFDSFRGTFEITQNLIFAWLYSSLILFYIFLNSAAFSTPATLFPGLLNPENMQLFFQQLIIPVVTALFFFGSIIFPRIPFSMGGGEPREAKVFLLDKQFEVNSRVFLLGESSQFVFIISTNASSSHAYQLNKNIVKYIETRTK